MNNELAMNWKKIATRLKELREDKGFSHEKLSDELTKKYGKKSDKFEKRITKQSLIDYEVNEEHHAKSGKVKGMSIENLYMLADFYNVSADYILCKTDCKSSDITTEGICKKTCLSEKSIRNLINLKEAEYYETLAWINALLAENIFDKNSFINLLLDFDTYQAIFYNYKLFLEEKKEAEEANISDKNGVKKYLEYFKQYIDYPKILVSIEENGKSVSKIDMPVDIAKDAFEKTMQDRFINIINRIFDEKWNEYKNSTLKKEMKRSDN